MDVMQMAGHLSLEFGAIVEGPFTEAGTTCVRLWMPNARGISLAHKTERDADGTAELLVIRESVGETDGTIPWRADYSTPVTTCSGDPAVRAVGVIGGADLDRARAALRTLRELGQIDPRDQRSTRDM